MALKLKEVLVEPKIPNAACPCIFNTESGTEVRVYRNGNVHVTTLKGGQEVDDCQCRPKSVPDKVIEILNESETCWYNGGVTVLLNNLETHFCLRNGSKNPHFRILCLTQSNATEVGKLIAAMGYKARRSGGTVLLTDDARYETLIRMAVDIHTRLSEVNSKYVAGKAPKPPQFSDPIRDKIQELILDINTSYIELSILVGRVHSGKLFKAWGFKKFSDWAKSEFELGRRNAYYLTQVSSYLNEQKRKHPNTYDDLVSVMCSVGFSKAILISRYGIKTSLSSTFHRAKQMSVPEFEKWLSNDNPNKSTTKRVVLKFSLSQMKVFKRAYKEAVKNGCQSKEEFIQGLLLASQM